MTAFGSRTRRLDEILMNLAGIVKWAGWTHIAPGPVVHEPIMGFIRDSVKIRYYPVRFLEDMLTELMKLSGPGNVDVFCAADGNSF